MRNKYTKMLTAAVLFSLVGCSAPDINVYAMKMPKITVRDFYSAPIEGYGFLQDNDGKIADRFYATLVPTWNGNEGRLVEKQWNDKGKLFFQQVWDIKLLGDGSDFTATATRIDGSVQGATSGYAMHMTYVLVSSTKKGDDIKLNADDWTYLQPDGSGINRVGLSKYGFHVGDVIYDLHKVPEGEQLHEGYF